MLLCPVMKAKQLTVFVNDVPGSLARIARSLAENKVNIQALVGIGSESLSPVRMLVDSPARAKKALRQAGLEPIEDEVLLVTLPDKPGALADFTEKLAAAGINISHAYATSAGGKKVTCVLAVSDLARASRLARSVGH